ncbi:hypothetical protein ANCCAN_04060 [Ancylostoma caninum]|uniref:Uncharacterized protein n=1 Tax=Ancylostoma caninum TaxID=29170 RepID=A0A368H3I6_ANCCA|nr:hypothetical protein ANCCAN_04060 [Ancylostoma caninum]
MSRLVLFLLVGLVAIVSSQPPPSFERELLHSPPRKTRSAILRSMLDQLFAKTSKDVQDQFRAVIEDGSISSDDKRKKLRELAKTVFKGVVLEKFYNMVQGHRST